MPNHGGGGVPWPQEHTDELIRLAKEELSYRAIARLMTEKFGIPYNRNMMIGKAKRIGIVKAAAPQKPRGKTVKRSPKPRVARTTPFRKTKVHAPSFRIVSANANSSAVKIIKTVRTELAELRCVEVNPRHLDLIELEPNDCRAPYGDGPITFCGHPKREGSSYCGPHGAMFREERRTRIDRRYSRAAA
jgi:GcrA cell cycle regulator